MELVGMTGRDLGGVSEASLAADSTTSTYLYHAMKSA
jgi:hypothetical protein